MKRKKKRSIFCLLLLVLAILTLSITACEAEDDYARITDVEYKAVVMDEPDNNGKILITERLTYDIHADSEYNLFWELWRDLPENYIDGLKVDYKVNSVKQIYPDSILIFVLPPSLGELKSRLSSRGTETEEQMQERLSCAFEEIKQIKDYNYFIFNETNKEVEAAIEIENIINAEKNKSVRYEDEIIRKFREEL